MTSFASLCPADPLALTDTQRTDYILNRLYDSPYECTTELHCSFFFDGTDNNNERDKPKQKHTNVGRLYDVFEQERLPGGSRQISFRNYAAGVGTPFKDEVGDTGTGVQRKAGLSTGWGGEARINWALLRLHDNLHFHFFNQSLTQALEQTAPALVKRMSADLSFSAMQMRDLGKSEVDLLRDVSGMDSVRAMRDMTLHAPRDAERKAVLAERRQALAECLAQLARNQPEVRRIRVSVFGFSRGASQARTFCHWLADALDPDFTLAGIPVQVDFLGIFDTVASVGTPQSLLEGLFTGHYGWAREEYLRVPHYVRRCVHLVAGHECRGSFPLDRAIASAPAAMQQREVAPARHADKNDARIGVATLARTEWRFVPTAPANAVEEVVYPGMHADVGGGYAPGEQGRAMTDSDKPSQVALCHMYREAIVAGVPLNVKGSTSESARAAFTVSPALRDAFNGYVNATTALGSDVPSTMKAHYGQYLRWRRLRLGGHDWNGQERPEAMERQPFFRRASAQAQEDMRTANQSLRDEVEGLLQDAHGNAGCEQSKAMLLVCGANPALSLALRVRHALYSEKTEQWRQASPYWSEHEPLDARIVRFLDEHIHDSRAGFRPFAEEPAVWEANEKARYEQLRQAVHADQYRGMGTGGMREAPIPSTSLTADERQQMEDMAEGKVPVQRTGPEFSSFWGYMHFRVLYPLASDKAVRANTG